MLVNSHWVIPGINQLPQVSLVAYRQYLTALVLARDAAVKIINIKAKQSDVGRRPEDVGRVS